jgi:uncharacterized protein (TIGR03546 family)
MTLLLKQIFNFFKILNSETGTNQIAAGIACGMIIGFAPVFSLQTLLMIVVIFMFRIQVGAATLAAFFFAFPAFLFDSFFHSIGSLILEWDVLRPLFTVLYNMPLVPFTRFYNSIVMGAGVTSILLAPFVFFISRILIAKYRSQVVERFRNSKTWRVVKATALYKWYAKYDELYN